MVQWQEFCPRNGILAHLIENIVVISAILISLFRHYQYLRGLWLRRMLEQKKKAMRLRRPMMLKPKSEHKCRFCKEEKGKHSTVEREEPEPWHLGC